MATVSSLFRTRLRVQSLCKLGRHHFINNTNNTLVTLGYFNSNRLYSSSSSSSNSKRNQQNSTNKQETFVESNYIDPRDLAHNTFFALHRPLPTINDQLAPVWGAGQQQPQGWEEEEEGVHSPLTKSTTTLILSPLQPSLPMTPDESQKVVDRFFSEIDGKKKKTRAASMAEEVNNVRRKKSTLAVNDYREVEGEDDDLTENNKVKTYYMTNVRQKRRLKMNKHKHKKLRKSQRALRKRLGK
ncbi:5914_t:CDS:2 [Ambispora gerdemannii]|uniref:Small ribosomal subunit protein mS38 n=1 Tax=Ambispora gerdemannii TaxID=144530 RepID=A0A9N9AC09_9GLOM|nr:5914_t:CDS:2 [Ambispora gerdemannii]